MGISLTIDHRLLRMIAFRVREEVDSSAGSKSRKPLTELGRNNTNLKTVAILPVNRHVPVDAFGRKLHAALEAAGASTSYLNQASVSDHLGRHAFTKVGKLKTAGWLADLEERYRIVLYVADSPVTNSWTHTCIRQVSQVAFSPVPELILRVCDRRIASWLSGWGMTPAWESTKSCYSR